MKKPWYKQSVGRLTERGEFARDIVRRICIVLGHASKRKFFVEMQLYGGVYEGHIIDSGKVRDADIRPDEVEEINDEWNEDIGMIFFGGYFSKKIYKDAESRAWESLMIDCMGADPDVGKYHNLTRSLETFGPRLDFNCKTVPELIEKLEKYEKEI